MVPPPSAACSPLGSFSPGTPDGLAGDDTACLGSEGASDATELDRPRGEGALARAIEEPLPITEA